jgi:hypothetical protein
MDNPPLGRKLIVRFINEIDRSRHKIMCDAARCEQPRKTWTFNSAGPSAGVQQERIHLGQENEVFTVVNIKAVIPCSSIYMAGSGSERLSASSFREEDLS